MNSRLTRTVELGFLLVLGVPALAQEPQRTSFATVQGLVVDSLRGGFASGAALRVTGTARFAFADSLGRYRIDSIPVGSYSVELFHEILDTLGVDVHTPPITFALDAVVSLDLGIPSAETIVRAKCPASVDGSRALMGVVLDADSEEPLSGAEVRLSWVEIAVGREIGIRRELRRQTAATDAAGRYRICGLPNNLSADVSASRGRDSTSTVAVSLGEAALGVATLFMPVSDSGHSPAVPTVSAADAASIRGVVTDSAGRPIPGARVGLGSSPDAAVTDSAGAFALSGRRSGTQALIVRRLGYRPAEVIVNLTSRAPREVVVRLDMFVPTLEAVYIGARRDLALERVGFAGRRRMGMGRHMTQVDLDRRHAFVVSDFLRHLPSARANGFGGACTIYWVDGFRWHGSADDFVTPSEVAAIEVYSDSFVPAEFQSFEGACQVVVIWTKWKLGIR